MMIDRRFFLASALSVGLATKQGSAMDNLVDLARSLSVDEDVPNIAVATLNAGSPAQSFMISGSVEAPSKMAVFQAASLAKPIVALLTMHLVRAGDLNLDQPVDRFMSDGYLHRQNIFALNAAPIIDLVPVEILRQITPRMLLSQTAGFPNWCPSGPLGLESKPGTIWQYSGEGYMLLQRVIERIAGVGLQQAADKILFQPLGLAGTAFKTVESIKPHLVNGTPRQLRFPYEIAASSLYTTADDYAKLLANTLQHEEVVSLITKEPIRLPSSWTDYFSPTQLAWGLGWGLEVREMPVSLWHWGSNPGFRSLVVADLRSRNAIVVLTSSDNGMAAAKRLVAAETGWHPGLDFEMVR